MALFAAPASAATTLKSIDAVLALGYEIKAINMLPAGDARMVFAFGAATPVAETIITLQKGNSIAVCSSPRPC